MTTERIEGEHYYAQKYVGSAYRVYNKNRKGCLAEDVVAKAEWLVAELDATANRFIEQGRRAALEEVEGLRSAAVRLCDALEASPEVGESSCTIERCAPLTPIRLIELRRAAANQMKGEGE